MPAPAAAIPTRILPPLKVFLPLPLLLSCYWYLQVQGGTFLMSECALAAAWSQQSASAMAVVVTAGHVMGNDTPAAG